MIPKPKEVTTDRIDFAAEAGPMEIDVFDLVQRGCPNIGVDGLVPRFLRVRTARNGSHGLFLDRQFRWLVGNVPEFRAFEAALADRTILVLTVPQMDTFLAELMATDGQRANLKLALANGADATRAAGG